ncbi:MAG: SGNH/GDSL hydrolase family protein [Oscillospiraceae bacterium]|nr:SGNH/GDSL hydrolase family protein [Oscillospiraceae bacterium]
MEERKGAADFDKNMVVHTTIDEPDLVWLDVRDEPFSLHGVWFDEQQGTYVRMPQAIADATNEGVAHLNKNTAGGRVRFVTDSPVIAIHAVMKNEPANDHLTLCGQSGFDLYRKQADGTDVFVRTFRPPVGMKEGYSSLLPAPAEAGEYTVNFPLYDNVQAVYIGLKRTALLEAAPAYPNEKPVVYYGSSITQGGCASRPGNSYQAILSRRLNIDYINLGFSGSGRAEKVMCEYLAGLEMSVFVCDYDHNAPTLEHLQATHLPLLRTVRAAQPTLPILVLSAPDVLLGDAAFWQPRRELIRKNVETLQAEGDTNIVFLDGAGLFAGEGWDSCTVDGCHPNDLGFWRMAQAIEPVLKALLEK